MNESLFSESDQLMCGRHHCFPGFWAVFVPDYPELEDWGIHYAHTVEDGSFNPLHHLLWTDVCHGFTLEEAIANAYQRKCGKAFTEYESDLEIWTARQ